MAAVSLSPAPHNFVGMSSKRIPLGDVPNATNSPFRAVAAAASKRSREQAEANENLLYDLQPRAKRQAFDNGRFDQPTPPRRQASQAMDDRVFDRRPTNSHPTAFQKKLLAAREEKSKQRIEKQEKAANVQMDEVRQWQKHYKKLFPSFVFYFESLPEDLRVNCSKHVKSLGAVSLPSDVVLVRFTDVALVNREKRSSSQGKLLMSLRQGRYRQRAIHGTRQTQACLLRHQ